MERAPGPALLHSASQLIRLLEQETRLLQAMSPQEIAGLQEEKATLVSDYQDKLTALTAIAESSQGLAPAVRQELAAATTALRSAIEENQRALTAAKLAADQLVQSIAAAVLEEQRVRDQYRADGRSGSEGASNAPVAVSLNQVL